MTNDNVKKGKGRKNISFPPFYFVLFLFGIDFVGKKHTFC